MAYYENSIDRYHTTLDMIVPELSQLEDPVIYDVGGYGYMTDIIRKKFGFNRLYDVASPDLNTIQLDLEDNSADFVLLCEVIEHLYNPDLVLSECRRVLKKNGTLVLTTPNLASWFNRILLVTGYFPMNMDISCQLRYSGKKDILSKKPVSGVLFNPLYDVHVRLYTVRTLEILFKEWRFEVVDTCGYVVSESTNHNINFALDMINRFFGQFTSLAQGLVLKAKAV